MTRGNIPQRTRRVGCYSAVVDGNEQFRNRVPPGLCAQCRHAREITSDGGSVFRMCELSFVDPRFAKYPPLPVLDCSGYVDAKRQE